MSVSLERTSPTGALSEPDRALLHVVGERVRHFRAVQGLTRRELAENSEVSERYLAQLEAGVGNPSLLVLQRIATALRTTSFALLTTESDTPVELTALIQQLRTLPPNVLDQVKRDIARHSRGANAARLQRIALIGLRGAGKSTLGGRLARKLKIPFVELDQEIERAAGASLSEIFLLYGQAGYRRYEHKTLQQVLAQHPRCVIVTGGSIVSEAETYALLMGQCYTVWLRATPEEHMARVIAQGDLRPMTGQPEAMEDLRHILHERASGYAQADITVDTAGHTIDAAFAALVHALEPVLDARSGV